MNVQQAYAACQRAAAAHYENFPVASFLLPKRLRQPVAAIYGFARLADDWADEGDWPPERRLQELRQLGERIERLANGQVDHDDALDIALSDTLRRFALPTQPFHDLLSAFTQDVSTTRYHSFGDVMDYCRRSANPIGRLLLMLNDQASEDRLGASDAVCSALQLINFYQDLSQDLEEMNRIYLPLDEMQQFGVSEDDIRHARNGPNVTRLMQHQYRRADQLLRSGAVLGKRLPGRLGLEIRAIVLGGARVLYRLKQQDDVFSRPRLTRKDRLMILWGALFPNHSG